MAPVAASLGRRGAAPMFLASPVLTEPAVLRGVARAAARWRGGTSRLARDGALHGALRLLLLASGMRAEAAPGRDRVRQAVAIARRHIEDHVADPIPLDRLAAVVGVSPHHLAREFRAAIGMPPHAYQLQLRIMHAKRAILAGRPLAEVAADLGFADQSHLGRHFRRLVAVTPGDCGRGADGAARSF